MYVLSAIVGVVFVAGALRLLLQPRFFILYPIILNAAWVTASLLYIERGAFLTESGVFAFVSGATLGHIGFALVFLVGFAAARSAVYLFRESRSSRSPELDLVTSDAALHAAPWFGAALGATAAALLLLWVNLALSPKPLLNEEVDRFNFWDYAALPQLTIVFGNITTIFSFVLGYCYWYFKKVSNRAAQFAWLRLVAGALFTCYVVYLILLGHKFSALETSAFYFVLAFVVHSRGRLRITRPVVLGVGVLGVLVFSLVYYDYARYAYYVDITPSTMGQIAYRALGLQGGAWWTMFTAAVSGVLEPTYHLGDMLEGMYHVMFYQSGYTPTVVEFIEMGGKYTNAYPAILLYVYPPLIAVAVQFLMGFGTGLFVLYVWRCIRRLYVVRAILGVQLMMWLYYAEIQAFFSKVLSPPFALFATIVLVAEVVHWSRTMPVTAAAEPLVSRPLLS